MSCKTGVHGEVSYETTELGYIFRCKNCGLALSSDEIEEEILARTLEDIAKNCPAFDGVVRLESERYSIEYLEKSNGY